MATRSVISIKVNNRLIKAIYCHLDGHPQGVGKILLDSYDETKTLQLIQLGSISSLERNLFPENPTHHTFNYPEPNIVVAYHRDRGEPLVINTFTSRKKLLNHFYEYIDWFYLFENGEWFVKQGGAFKDLQTSNWIRLKTLLNSKK